MDPLKPRVPAAAVVGGGRLRVARRASRVVRRASCVVPVVVPCGGALRQGAMPFERSVRGVVVVGS